MTNVYFVANASRTAVKVGHTGWPLFRLQQLMNWSPEPLEILAHTPGSRLDEAFIHQMFDENRLHSEWFRLTPAMAEIAAAIKATGTFIFRPDPMPDRRTHVSNVRHVREQVFGLDRAAFATLLGLVKASVMHAENGEWVGAETAAKLLWIAHRKNIPLKTADLFRLKAAPLKAAA